MISLKAKGDFKNTENLIQRVKEIAHLSILDKYGKIGVEALANATPVDTGETASSWNYSIEHGKNGASLTRNNSNINNGVPIAIIIQYGHGTRGGGYVQGRDYINPAMRPVFDEIADRVWKEVTG